MMCARHRARGSARARLKIAIFDFSMLISRDRQMRRFDAPRKLVDVFGGCKLEKPLNLSIILRFHAFWMDIKKIGKN